MRPIEGRIRRLLNPLSTALTQRWNGHVWRQVPPRGQPPRQRAGPAPAPAATPGGRPRATATFLLPSPGDWEVPAGLRPGWQWLPEPGALSILRDKPWWVRVWFNTPLLDRFAYEWMWWHGGWAVPSTSRPDEPGAGVPEPRRPLPNLPSGRAQIAAEGFRPSAG